MTHILIQAIGNYNTLWFWYMVPEPHGCLYIEIYFLIILFQVTIYFQYVHDYFNVHLRCCVLCHYYMFYGRLRFYCILIVYAKFFMFTLFLLYLVRNDNNKDDQSWSIDILRKEVFSDIETGPWIFTQVWWCTIYGNIPQWLKKYFISCVQNLILKWKHMVLKMYTSQTFRLPLSKGVQVKLWL